MSGQFIPLEQTCDFLSGYAWSAANFDADPVGLPIIRIQNVDAVRDSDFVYWPGEYDERFVVRAGDLLLTLSGSFRAVVWQGPDALLNQRIVKLTPKPGYSLDWLLHVLRNGLNTISGLGRHALVSNVALADLRQLKVPSQASEEQRRIAAILDKAETLRTQRRQALAHLDTLTQSLFLDMFGDPVVNPKGWSLSTIGKIAGVQGGLQVTTARKDLPLEAPYLRVANVYRGFLDLSEIKTIRGTPAEVARTTLEKDDLLVVEGHGNPNEIGRAALWTGEIAGCLHQNHLIRARFDLSKVVPVFACEYVNSPGGRMHLLRAGKSTSGLNTISVSNVRETPVALPPLPLQQTFASRIQAIEALKATHRTALAQLDALFASLQQRAFAGEL